VLGAAPTALSLVPLPPPTTGGPKGQTGDRDKGIKGLTGLLRQRGKGRDLLPSPLV